MDDSVFLERIVSSDPLPFRELLNQLSNPDTAQRSQAESIFTTLKERAPEPLVGKLVETIRIDDLPERRVLAATLLRQVLSKEQPSLWISVSVQGQETIRGQLLAALTQEPNRDVAFKVADVVSELFAKIVGNECWPELLPFICQQISHQQHTPGTLVVICVYILAEIAPVLADSMDRSVSQFVGLMQQSLSHPDLPVRFISMKAIKCFALALDNLSDVNQLKVLMRDVLNAFSHIRVESMEATEAYATLIEMAQYVPSLFEDVLGDVLTGFLSRLKDAAGDVDGKTMALEFLLTLLEGLTDEQMETVKGAVLELVAILMESLLLIQDVPDWYMKCGGGDGSSDFGEIHDLVIESFDRLASSLPGSVFLPIFSPYTQQWMNDQDWKKRHAVLSVMGQMAEGCSAEVTESALPLLELGIRGLSDPHVRVRWAACQALGLVADEVGSSLTKTQRDQLITELMKASVIDDPGAVAVQEHALRCLVNVIGQSAIPLKGPILDEIVTWLLQSMKFDRASVKDAAMDALSCLTSVCKAPAFAQYYPDCMKVIFEAMQGFKDVTKLEEISMIVDVMTRVGAAAGRECFIREYRIVVDCLKGLMDQSIQLNDKDDRMAVFINILNAITRIGSIMTTDFDALELFQPLLLEALATEPKLESLPADQIDDEDEDDFTINIAGKVFRIEQMPLAFCQCGMTSAVSLAGDLKHVFFPALVPTLETFLPAMEYKVMKDIQQMAIQAQPVLLECATEKHRLEPTVDAHNFIVNLLNKQWGAYLMKLGDMENETNEASAATVMEAVAKTIEILTGNVESNMMHELFEKIPHILQHFLRLRRERAAVQDGELNEEEAEEFTEEVATEHGIFVSIQKLFAAVLMHTGDLYFDRIDIFVHTLHGLLASLQDEESDYERMETILTIMTDLCEYSQRGREKYASDVCVLFISKLDHVSTGVRHISAFGLGILSQKAPEFLRPHWSEAAGKLKDVIQMDKASLVSSKEMSFDQGMALDNAVAALGKMIFGSMDIFGDADRRVLMTSWLSGLPLRHDIDEAMVAHKQLISALNQRDSALLGAIQSVRGTESEKCCLGVHGEQVMAVMDVLMEILANETPLGTGEDLREATAMLKTFESDAGCSQYAIQKMQKWSQEERVQFTQMMATLQQ